MEEKQDTTAQLQQQVIGIGTILQLEKQSRHAASEAEHGFVVVNETFRLINYRQAVLCRRRPSGALTVKAVSQVDTPEKNAPFIVWLQRLLKKILKTHNPAEPFTVSQEEIPTAFHKGWEEWSAPYGLWCPLQSGDTLLGGIWFSRETPWETPEIALLNQLADAYGHDWLALRQRPGRLRKVSGNLVSGWPLKLFFIALVSVLLALPVPLTVMAPAQVIPIDPVVITSPLNGVIKQFHIQPNQEVTKGQLLFSLDDTDLRNRHAVAVKALAVIKAELKRTTQKSLITVKGSGDADLLRARVKSKEAEVRFAADELARIQVHAERDGIAVFGDVNDWIGKPVVTGEKVMTLADPGRTEIEIWVPVDNAVNLKQDAQVRMFLNIDPTHVLRAKIRQTSYEPLVSPENVLAFPVKAAFEPKTSSARVGLRGTAKIYGEKTRLYYYLLRRPMAAARKMLDW